MLRLEWIGRLFSVIMALFLGLFLDAKDIAFIVHLFLYVSIAYSLILLFKKQLYPWPIGSYYNLTIEASELMLLLYLHSASSSPFIIVLFISFILRMVCLYDKKINIGLGIIAALTFILVDYYAVSGESTSYIVSRLIYWAISFGAYIWFLQVLSGYINKLENMNKDLKVTINLRDIIIDELNESRDSLLEERDELYIWANRDPLTNLYNSRYFNRYWDNIYNQFSQLKQRDYPITLIMAEVQGHRIYRNVYGHAAGDLLIKDLAVILKECCEAEDIVVRYSDYVFAIVIPGQGEGEAIEFYHRFKKAIETYSKEHSGMRNIDIFMGWSSCIDVVHETREELMARATNNMRPID